MGTAAAGKEIFGKHILSNALFIALVDQHNQLVIDTHEIAALADGDATLTDTDYEAGLTALEIPYDGYTPTETAVADQLTKGPQDLLDSEKWFNDVVAQLNAMHADIAAFSAKVDADTGDTTFASLVDALDLTAYGYTGTDPRLFEDEGDGISGRLLQAMVELFNTMLQDWHDVTAGMDGDDGIAETTYEAQIDATTISQES